MVHITMQFQVPQFIDIEDKIIGPLTLKQFAYIAVGGFVLFLLYYLLQFWLWLMIGSIVGLFIAGLAFFKYNGRPFMVLVFAFFNYFWQPRLYIWKAEKTLRDSSGQGEIKKGGLSVLGFKLNTFTSPLSDRREKPLRQLKEKFEIFRKLTGDREVARRIDYR